MELPQVCAGQLLVLGYGWVIQHRPIFEIMNKNKQLCCLAKNIGYMRNKNTKFIIARKKQSKHYIGSAHFGGVRYIGRSSPKRCL